MISVKRTKCYCIVWSVEKTQKNPKFATTKTKTEKWCFYQNVQCATVKNQDLSKTKKLVDY